MVRFEGVAQGGAGLEVIGVAAALAFAGQLAARLEALATGRLRLNMITNRGVKVWPGGQPETFRADHWSCRFLADGDGPVLDFIKTEHLYTFDGVPGFSLGQGQ